jgi:glycosyltransferase involved in cell wall biosynthesis
VWLILLKDNKHKHLVFVSYEIHPVNAGGCGVFLSHALNKLLITNQYRITLLLDMPKHECELFEEKYKPSFPNSHLLDVVCLSSLLADSVLEITMEDLQNIFLWKSYRFYYALLELEKEQPLDYVEFFDYAGVGYYAIRAKKYEGKFRNSIFGIRAHCTIDLMDAEQAQSELSMERLLMYQMEKEALKDCDVLMAPSKAWKELYVTRYGVPKQNVIVSPPPMDFSELPRRKGDSFEPNVLFYGRLFQLKGIDIFVDAAIQYIASNPKSATKFYIVGYDGQTTSGGSYQKYLLERIPLGYREHFIFTGFINRQELGEIIKKVQVAVFPNYIESFSYSIHEIYHAGVPIICRSIPAFKDYFVDQENCITFDGTVHDLVTKIQEFLSNPDLRERLSYPYKVLDDSIFVYSYEQATKLNFNQDLLGENVKDKVSIILLDDENRNEVGIEHTIKSLPDGIVSKDKSYKLCSSPKGNDDIPVHFLGRIWYVSNLYTDVSINSMLILEKYAWICRAGESCELNFFSDALSVFNRSSDIQYVSSYVKCMNAVGDTFNRCIPYDLLASFAHWKLNSVNNVIVSVPAGHSLRDLYEPRLNTLGEHEFLIRKGYVLPYLLQRVRQTEEKVTDWNSLKFLIHHASIGQEWNPSSLSPLLYLKQSQEQGVHLNLTVGFSWKRLFVNKIKNYLDSKTGRFGRMQYKVFRFLYNVAKRL